jgi:hypothetical protein
VFEGSVDEEEDEDEEVSEVQKPYRQRLPKDFLQKIDDFIIENQKEGARKPIELYRQFIVDGKEEYDELRIHKTFQNRFSKWRRAMLSKTI